MTTTVTVKTHDWPVQVRAKPLSNREPVEGAEGYVSTVPPNSSQDFIVHNGQDLAIHEMPSEAELGVTRTKPGDVQTFDSGGQPQPPPPPPHQ